MEQFDLAVISSYHQEILSAEWFFTISALNKRCILVTPNPNEYAMLKKQGVTVAYLKDFFPERIPGRKQIQEYFNNKGVFDLVEYVGTERSYYQQSNAHLIRYTYKYAYAFEKFYQSIKIKTVLHPVQGGEIIRRTASLIANEQSIPVIYLGETFIPGTVNLYSDEYRTVLKPIVPRELPEEKAKSIIEDKINRKRVVYYETEKRRFVPTPMFEKMYNLVKDGNWNIIRAYIARKKVISVDFLIREIYTRLAGVFKKFDPSEKYFYLPFNVDAESELYIRNPGFIDQVAAVGRLAKHLPDGYKLYVKTHPGREGHLTIDSYRRLVKLKNVIPLKGNVNSFDVVKHSQGVVLASSTVGLESYIMGKPTCIIGHWPYAAYGNFIRVKNFNEVFQKMLSPDKPNDPIRFVQNVYKESVDGGIYADSKDFKALVESLFKMTYLKDI
jgi:capsule polysaccharide modification protein KpsS